MISQYHDVFATFAAIAATYPNKVAVDDGTERLTYVQLHRSALHTAACLAAAVPPSRLVAIATGTNVYCTIAMLACLAARRPFAVLDPSYPHARNAAIAAEAGFGAVLVTEGSRAHPMWLPADVALVPISLHRKADMALPPTRDGSDEPGPAFIIYTSGSTGRPRGIAHHEGVIRRMVEGHTSTIGLGQADRVLPLHSSSTFVGIRDPFGALLTGATLHLVDLPADGLGELCSVLRYARITVCSMVPALARLLARAADAASTFRTLRTFRLGGDAVFGSDISVLRQVLPADCQISLTYGTSEAGWVLGRLLRATDAVVPGRVSLGSPLPGNDLCLVDQHGRPVADGQPGELVIRSPYVALGTWVDGALDRTGVRSDPDDPACRIWPTRDLFVRSPEGGLIHLGRVDRQVKIRGMRVEPGDLEAVLRGLQGVADAAVLAVSQGPDVALHAFAVPAGDVEDQPFERRIMRALQNDVPDFLRPAAVHAVSAIPRLPSYKLDVQALEALVAASTC